MKICLKPLFILIILSKIFLISQKGLNPLSECEKGRISKYIGWEEGGHCSFPSHTKAIGSTYLYPSAPNYDLFVSTTHCGTCYEIVGPYGAIRTRVESYCPKDDESGLCIGDINHFNVAHNGSSYLMGNGELANVTFRMVECGFSGNIRILSDESSDKYAFSFIILDHNLPVNSVSIQENGSETWEKIVRDEYNYWTYDTGYEILYPLKIMIYSINGDFVTVNVENLNTEGIYEANGNFKTVNDTYFDITTFNKKEKPTDTENCCERDISDYSPIYKDGYINDYYNNHEQRVSVDYNSSELYQEQNSIKATFQSFGYLTFETSYTIRADLFSGVSIAIKASKNCLNCFYIRASDLENKIQVLNLNTVNKWKVYRFEFDTLGIEDNKFKGIVLGYNSTVEPFEISIGSIELIGKRNRPNDGICVDIAEKEIINVNILNIKSFEELPFLINVTCENFNKINDEKMVLIFSTSDNSISFQTQNCELPNAESINSFSCQLPNDIPNGEFYIHSPSDSSYSINYSKNILTNNGIITFDYFPDVKTDSEEILNEPTQITYPPIVIVNSIDKEINKGDPMTFQISSIEPNKFHLENKQIIFLDTTKTKALFFKDCNEYIYSNMVIAIKCTLSNNVIKGNYTTLADNQNISIDSNKKINLRINESNGGLFSQTVSRIIDTKNLEKSQLKTFNLTFNILYYNSSIKLGDLFPFKVYLYGNKKTLRNLEESNYNLSILFPNCTADSYSNEDSSAIGTIRCNVPDYIHAGTYNKLISDGFDTMPNTQINLEFTNDFDRADNPITNVNIISIKTVDGIPFLINVACESFNKINNGNMNLIFISSDNSNSFRTESCSLPNTENINLFQCQIPTNLPNGIFSVKSTSDSAYSVNYDKNILINDGTITFDYVAETDKPSENIAFSPIIISSSYDMVINKGESVTLQISSIEPNKFYLENKEIIFLDSTKTKSLYFKDCNEYIYNGMAIAIKCTVSNNVIKGDYITLADNQNISISTDKSIKFIINESNGGIFSEIISRTIDSKSLDNTQLKNYNLSFNILYYNSSVKIGDLFPHKVYLYGNKKTLRNLEESYDLSISFPNCTAVSYSSEDSSAIGNIQCNVPDYIPAGIYKKLVSDGFDVMPNSQINLDFINDFNKSAANTPIINVNIITINYLDGLNFLINVTSESFNNVNNENLILEFVSRDNSNSFQTESCDLPSSMNIVSFSCRIPTDAANGEYIIKSPSNSKYSINYSKRILINNGVITFDYSPDIVTDSITDDFSNSQIEINNSIEKLIKKGDYITFPISSIEPSKYHLENKQIIFLDAGKTKSLYLKNCKEYTYIDSVVGINCIVSNNVIKANYSILADNQNITIKKDKTINLIVNESNGGLFSETISRTIDSKTLDNTQLKNYNLSFNILYYNSSVKIGDLFPHKVYLYGNKKTLRNLEESYDLSISFPNCTAVSYSSEDSSAIGNIQCNVPDYIPAGIYKKLVSDGFDVMPNSQINLDFTNDFNKAIDNSNLIYINIINISSLENNPSFINITCQSFNNINGENINILFTSTSNKTNYFQTENCILAPLESITSFICKMPENIKDDNYKVQSISDSKYQIIYPKNIEINNGIIEINNNYPEEMEETTIPIAYSQIIIKNSVEQFLRKGENIVFHIEDIEEEKFHLDNNEIIFLDDSKQKALYLINCKKYNSNVIVQSIRCNINNCMKGVYTTLADGQHISTSPNVNINLVSLNSTGGSFSDVISRTIDSTNLTKRELDSYILPLDILYYNSSVKPGNLFPHKVYLFGNYIRNTRNLEETTYTLSFLFPNCTTGRYSIEDPSAIGSINCRFPDYIPAGEYTKIKSDGFDVMPNGKINLVFPKDFNRKTNSTILEDRDDDDDSSSSKTWIIWLIAGILLLVLIVIVIIACVANRKGRNEESQNNNDSSAGNMQNNTQNKTEDS